MGADIQRVRAALLADSTRLPARSIDFVCDDGHTVVALLHSREAGRDLLVSQLDQRGYRGSSRGWSGTAELLNGDEPLDAWRVTFHCHRCRRNYPNRKLSDLAVEAGQARDGGRGYVRLGRQRPQR
jgi:hypothetical protein